MAEFTSAGFAPHEAEAMRRALQLAARGRPHTSPNPMVGCVLLDKSGATVGEGWHRYAGGPHAEVEALRDAGSAARGATAVVTLEPCDRTGRTGPCTRALAEAGVTRVVYAAGDPGYAAGQGGADTLTAAGVEVAGGLLADEAMELNAAWFAAARGGCRGRPYVTWKFAATLDGRVAAADGSSRWISGPESREDAHRLRAESDAVLVGAGTVRADDPQLAVRGIDGARQPLRVVVDSDATAVRPGARILDDAAPTLIAVAAGAESGERDPARIADPAAYADPERAKRLGELAGLAEVVSVPRRPGPRPGLDLRALLDALYQRDVARLLVEGGPTLAGAFVGAGLVDRVVAYLAPALLGSGPPALADAGIGTIADAVRPTVTECVPIGADLRLTAEFRDRAEGVDEDSADARDNDLAAPAVRAHTHSHTAQSQTAHIRTS